MRRLTYSKHTRRGLKLRTSQFTIHDILGVIRRRKRLILLPMFIVTFLCTLGAFILPRKYESSTTILVQRDETLNPLISYEMAVSMASEDRLRTFNEIVYSRPVLETVIDTLGLQKGLMTDLEREELLKDLKRDIRTDRSGDSFNITFVDTDPLRAQMGVALLAELFIKTRLHVEHQRDELTVEFFEKKLEEFRQKFEENQKKLISAMGQRIDEMPMESRTLYTDMENQDRQIGDLDTRIKALQG